MDQSVSDLSALRGMLLGGTALALVAMLPEIASAQNASYSCSSSSVIKNCGPTGINVAASGSGTVNVISSGGVTANNDIGIQTIAVNGATQIVANGSMRGTFGITAFATGGGAITVTTGGAVTGTSNEGIVTRAVDGATQIIANGSVISALGAGIDAQSFGTSTISIAGSGNVTASNGSAGAAIFAYAEKAIGTNGIPLITVGGTGDSISTNSGWGIHAVAINSAAVGDVVVNRSGSVTGSGTYSGIYARNAGTGSVIITNTGAVQSAGASGIIAEAQSGNVIVAPASTVVGTFGIQALTTSNGAITVTTAGAVTGTTKSGIQTRTVDGKTEITANGSVRGTIYAVDARASGAGTISVTTAGGVTAGGAGVFAKSGTGAVTATNAAGSTIAAPTGIVAGTEGAVQVNNSGMIAGATVGIAAAGARANVTNEAGGQISFGLLGLSAASSGSLVLTNNGTLTQDRTLPSTLTQAQLSILPASFQTIGSTANGAIYGRTAGGDLTVTNRGSITGTTGINVAINPTQLGGSASTPIGILKITNENTITTTRAAIDTSQSVAAAQVINSGMINGFVTLNNGSSFTNTQRGQFNASGTSTFGGGTFTNNGTVALASNTASITIGTFENAGTINLQNGAPGNTLTINGNYVGQNGVVNAGFSSQTSTSDRLVINGNASGTSTINVTNIGSVVPFTTGAAIVQVMGTAPQGTFNLGTLQNFGTLQVQLVGQSSQGGNSFVISPVAGPNALAQSGATASTATRTLAFQGSTVILDRVTQLRQERQNAQGLGQPSIPELMQYAGMNQYAALISKDPIAPQIVQPASAPVSNVRGAVFARAFGDFEHRSGFSNITVGGGSFRNDLSYNQSSGGVIGGADVVISGLTTPDDGLILGTFGGYTVASVQLARNAGHQFYEGGSAGVYTTYLKGGFFADALFKADLLGLNITGPNVRQNTGLQNYSLLGNIGYRFDLPHALYIEPTAGLEYVITNFDKTPLASATTVPLQDGDALRGRIGARLGTEFIENKIRFEPSITGLVTEVFSESGTTATFGSVTGVSGLKNVGKIRGEVQASLNFFNLTTGWSGFVRADYRIGSDLVGAGGRAGARYQW